jgi:putative SOS response-associated peptidase YedK
MYNMTPPPALSNLQPRYNVCPTDPVDVVLPGESGRQLEQMRWGLVPYWWSIRFCFRCLVGGLVAVPRHRKTFNIPLSVDHLSPCL